MSTPVGSQNRIRREAQRFVTMTCCLIPSLRGFGQAVPPVSFWKRDSGTTRHTLSEATFWVEGQPFSLRDGFWLLSPVADAPSRNGRRQLRRFAPRVKMLQYTQARQRYRGRCGSQPLFRWPPVRRILLQRVVDDQDTPPNSPEAAHSSPEEAVEGVQRRTRPLRFKTATCFRRVRTSRAVSPRLWKRTWMAARMERMSSNTNFS